MGKFHSLVILKKNQMYYIWIRSLIREGCLGILALSLPASREEIFQFFYFTVSIQLLKCDILC